ncbi:MAG: GrpB family protein [Christensenellales bacterium]
MSKLIFVEGVSGVGKSTTTQILRDKLREMGFSAECYKEFDFSNPIDFYCTAYLKHDQYADLLTKYEAFSEDIKRNTIIADDIRLVRYYDQKTPLFPEPLLDELHKHEFCWKPVNLVSLSEYSRVYKAVWENFAHNSKHQPDLLIFDGSLIHHPINDMMRNYDASYEQIVHHLNALIKAVESLHPQIIYLSSDSVSERLQKARTSRNEAPPSVEQIRFWEERKQMDLAVLRQLPIPHDTYDISEENWNVEIKSMIAHLLETPDQRRARIYPIILSEYNLAWPEWYAEEKANLERLIGADKVFRISHFGSTSVPGLMAKPTVDILLEINEDTDIEELVAALPSSEYICLRREGNSLSEHDLVMILKGYISDGFAEKVYHIHVRYNGDYDELYFSDHLIAHPEVAAEYADLKRGLFANYEHDRDGYTEAKGEFIKEITRNARKL